VRCWACGKSVPPGAFCGSCGADVSPHSRGALAWLRLHAYAAAPGEAVLRPSVVSSLFPRLPHASRPAFRMGLVALLAVLATLAVLRWQAPLIAVSALGLAVCFIVYLNDSDVFTDFPPTILLLTATAGVGLGVGWAVLTAPTLARSHMVALGAGMIMMQGRPLWEALSIVLGGAVLMLLPTVLLRIARPQRRESLDGFIIGSLGALCFAAAATMSRLVPQLATGPITHERPVTSLLVEAGIMGVATPLTAAAVGGMVGATLWFNRRTDTPQQHRWRAAAILSLELVVVIIAYGGLALVDGAPLAQGMKLGLYLLIAALTLVALRVVLQAAMLHEAFGGTSPDQPVICIECGYIVPQMAFCAQCGVAASASSPSSRVTRRTSRPVRIDPPTEEQ
jgi:hypothetical protein